MATMHKHHSNSATSHHLHSDTKHQEHAAIEEQPKTSQQMIDQMSHQHAHIPGNLVRRYMAGWWNKKLGLLTSLDQIVIKQKKHIFSVVTGCEMNNEYELYDIKGKLILTAMEQTDCLERVICGAERGFTIHIKDNYNVDVMRLFRKFKCCGCLCCCVGSDLCAWEVSVQSPPGEEIGYVRRLPYCCKPKLGLYNENHELFAIMGGPACTYSCCGRDVLFPAYTMDQKLQIGGCAKHWAGFLKEIFTDADVFRVFFLEHLDNKVKAIFIGALFFVDFLFFESRNN